MTEKEYRSKCCNAKVRTDGVPDFLGSKEVCTVHYICLKCNQPCDMRAAEKSVMIELNVNDDIQIRLTREGRKIYREHHKKYRHYPLEKATGRWFRIPLWAFMRIFGPILVLGGPAIIVGNVIRIPKS